MPSLYQFKGLLAVVAAIGLLLACGKKDTAAPGLFPAITSFTPTSGPAGTVVTITGADFGATPASNTVTVNGKAAVVTTATTTSLTFTVPSLAGSGSVAVKVNGETATSTTSYSYTYSYSISTVAGNDTYGFSGDGGLATNAQLNYPSSVAADANGNLYVVDYFNQRIRKVSPAGIITTVAGNGTAGNAGDGGLATNSQLNYPYGVAADANGNLYIADNFNNSIRKVDASGIITTVAGTGTAGFTGDGGTATSAQLKAPTGVTVDKYGVLYIADYGNNRIRRVDAMGTISTVAGVGMLGFSGDGGPATGAQLSHPYSVAVDANGSLYIADLDNYRVRKVDGLGRISTAAGVGTTGYSGDGGAAISAQFSKPTGVATDTLGNLFVTDKDNNRVRKIDASGSISTIAGTGAAGFGGDGGPADHAQLNELLGLTIDGTGNLYIADFANQRIRKLTLQ